MMSHHILEKAIELKVFQLWELTKELRKDWDYLYTSAQIKGRVRDWIKNNLSAGFLETVSREPLIFAIKDCRENWREHLRYIACPICGREFLPRKSQTIYCSDKCRGKAEYKKKRDKKKEYLKQRKDLIRRASQRYKQKLQELTPASKRGRWSPEELEILRNEYEKKGHLTRADLVKIALILGRSFSAVMHKYYEEVRSHETQNHPQGT